MTELEKFKSLKTTAVTNWLVEAGILYIKNENGKNRKVPTEIGIQLGITSEWKTGQYGEYFAVVYDSEAQKFILDNIEAILKAALNKADLMEFLGLTDY